MQFSGTSYLERFDREGIWLLTAGVAAASRPEWRTHGLGLIEPWLIAAEAIGIVPYSRTDLSGLDGRVVDSEGQGVAASRVSFESSLGSVLDATVDQHGAFQLEGASRSSIGTFTAKAPGYLLRKITGVLGETLAQSIVLEEATRYCVMVSDASTAEPVPRFSIQVSRRQVAASSLRHEDGPRENFENAEGLGCFRPPWSAPWIVLVSAPGYASRSMRIEEPQNLAVALELEARLTVEVVDDQQSPISDAEIWVERATEPRRPYRILREDQQGRTDPKGQASFDHLPAQAHRIEVSHPKYLPERHEITLETGDNEVEILLTPGAAVVASVRARTTGEGLGEAEVKLTLSGGRHASARLACTTDSEGDCTIEAVPAGRLVAKAFAAGFAEGRRVVTVAPDRETISLDFELGAGTRVLGRLMGHEAYGGIALAVTASIPGVPVQSSPVDPAGEFAFNDLPPGSVDLFVEDRRSGGTLLLERKEIPPKVESFSLTLELPPPIRLFGSVLNSGEPVAGASVHLNQLGAQVDTFWTSTTTDADGRYSLTVAEPGVYAAGAVGGEGDLRASRTLEVWQDLEVDFELAQGTLFGRVLTGAGEPAARATVRLRSLADSTQTLATEAGDLGDFRFSGLAAGEYRVLASDGSGVAFEDARLFDGDTVEVRLDLPAKKVVRLRPLDAETGLPLARITATVVSTSGEWATFPAVYSDKEGVAEIPALEPEPLILVLRSPGYALKTIRDVRVSAETLLPMNADARSFSVEVGKGSPPACFIELLDGSRRGVALDGGRPPGPLPFSSARALFNGLEAGSYTVVLHGCQGSRSEQPVVLAPGVNPTVVFGGP